MKKVIMSLLTTAGLLVTTAILIGCGANTMNLTSLHQDPLTKGGRHQSSSNQTFDFNVSVAQNDTIPESMEINNSDEICYAYHRLPFDFSFKSHLGVEGFHYTFGMGIGEGFISGISFTLFDFLQAHAWGSSWLFTNHKYGGGITASSPVEIISIDRTIVGYGVSKVNAYAIGCEGSCGLGGFDTVQGELSKFRHIFETSIGIKKLGVYVKIETAKKLSYELVSAGIRYKI